jgi:hypothetical protein
MVGLVGLDLILANRWLIVQSPESVIRPSLEMAGGLRPLAEQFAPRIKGSDVVYPNQWGETSSKDRLSEITRFEQESIYPKYHLWCGLNIVGSFHALEPADLRWFNEVADPTQALRLPGDPPESPGETVPRKTLIEWFSTNRRIDFVEEWAPAPFSRRNGLPAGLKGDFQESVLRDLDLLASSTSGGIDSDDPRAQLTVGKMAITPNELTLHVHSPGAGWLILKEYWDPGWRAWVCPAGGAFEHSVSVERFAGIWRAIRLPESGDFMVRFRYLPVGWNWALVASACGWLAAACIGVQGLRRNLMRR